MNHVLKTRGIPGVVYGASSIVRIHLDADAHALGLEDWTFDSARLDRGMGPLGAKLHLAMLLNGVDYSRGSAIGWLNARSEEHTSELQSRLHLVCRLLLEKKKKNNRITWRQHSHSVHLRPARLAPVPRVSPAA